MKKRISAALLTAVILLAGFAGCSQTNTASVWSEIPIKDGEFLALSEPVEFDLRKTITKSDYVFSGTVISRKEYEIKWTDDNGEPWGPFRKSVIEVKVNKEYSGKSPVKGDVIKVYCPYSLSTSFEDSFAIKENTEYIFLTQALDQEFTNFKSENSPQDAYEQEKYADVYISDPCYSVMPVNNGSVVLYSDYFSWDKDIMKKVKAWDTVSTDTISSSKFLENGWFITLDRKEFESAFLKLFDQPEKLPNLSDLQKLRESQGSMNSENNG